MENNSSISSSDAKMADLPEESSWAFYIYDDQISSFSSESETPSLISDAASNSAVKKLTNENVFGFSDCRKSINNRNLLCEENNNCKKKKNKVSSMDPALEDTASSPANSPKVSYIDQFMNQKEKSKMEVQKKGGVFSRERQADYMDLKKRTCN